MDVKVPCQKKALFGRPKLSGLSFNEVAHSISKQAFSSVSYLNNHTLFFSQKGLRTLCVAYRKFTEEEYKEVKQRLFEAKTALQQREERLAEAYNFIEKDLELLGATGVEDKYVLPVYLGKEILAQAE